MEYDYYYLIKKISNMRTLLTEDFVEIPDDGKCSWIVSPWNCSNLWQFGSVTVNVKARKITVKGSGGEVTKDFSHLAVEIQKTSLNAKKVKGNFIRIRMWFGGYKQACSVNTLKSLINNMITGVTEVSAAYHGLVSTRSLRRYWMCAMWFCFSLIQFNLLLYNV